MRFCILLLASMMALPVCHATHAKIANEPIYIGTLDSVEFHKGNFVVKLYSSYPHFKYYQIVYLKKLRADKNGVYFCDQDVTKIDYDEVPQDLQSKGVAIDRRLFNSLSKKDLECSKR